MTIHYRVQLILSEVRSTEDERGYPNSRSNTIADIDLTAGSPGSAMAQILPHVDQLNGWHSMAEAKVADDGR